MKSDLKFSAKMDKKTPAHIAILLPRMISRLKEMQKKDSRGIYWESLGGQRWGWQGGDTEITAHVLSALLESGDRTPVVSQAVNSLSKRGRGEAWSSTKETAAVFFSFCRYLDEAGGDITGAGRIDFRLDGEKVAAVSYDLKNDRDLQKLTSRVKIDKTKVKRSYRIDAEGTAGPDVSFDLTLSGSLYYREKGMLSFLKSEERGLKELANGMDVVRGFYTLLRVRDVNNNEYLVPQDLSGKNVLRVGDEIMVRIKFKAQDDFEYLVLEDYLPSGFEVVSKNAYDEYQPYSHQERWDNRMVFFFTKVRKGEVYEVAYIMRAELPGEFIVKPARMECMYEPSIQGWSLPARFRVEKK
jgi:uncharacterized protein YfaS (alpha-2-macroglobulin family)